MSVEAATDTAVFLAFLDRVLIPELVRTKPGAVVVMDDLSPHRAPAVRRRLEAAGFELLYHLPRYAPDLSPIEPLWSQLKALLRAAARTVAALEAALGAALAGITADDAWDWFQHCGYPLPAD
jgi:transposase